jgi:Ni/Co efflux regulator RcnB
MRRLIVILAAAAALSPTLASAQALTPNQQIRQNERNLRVQQQRDKADVNRQAAESRDLSQQSRDNLAILQAQGAQGAVNPGLAPGAPVPYASSSAAARGAATARGVPASAVVPNMVGGPLNLPGPTDPAVGAYTPEAPASHQPPTATPNG